MVAPLIPLIGSVIGKVVDRVVPDKAQAERLQARLMLELMNSANAELQGAVAIIQAEAQGESWLQRNWRPILMLTIVAIVANNYLVAPYLQAVFGPDSVPTLELPERLWNLMTLGVGGYVGGRTVEKVVQTWRQGPSK